MGLSRRRIRQLLQEYYVSAILTWLSHLHDPMSPSPGETTREQSASQHTLQTRLAEEVDSLRWCLAWLEQLGGNTIAHSGA